jgi:hypothetical protein
MPCKRNTIRLSDELLRELRETAARRGTSQSELVREDIEIILARYRRWDHSAELPLFNSDSFQGLRLSIIPGAAMTEDEIETALREGFGREEEEEEQDRRR